MSESLVPPNRRILVVDDSRAIHEDFRKILSQTECQLAAIDAAEASLFGDDAALPTAPIFSIDSAFQGQEGLGLVEQAVAAGQPYSLAFIDVRMPPGWDGVETTANIWKIDPDLQVVLCTAYSDYSWEEMAMKLGQSDRLVILKKPFDTIEARQLANSLAEKWRLLRQTRCQLAALEAVIQERTGQWRASERHFRSNLAAWIDELETALAEMGNPRAELLSNIDQPFEPSERVVRIIEAMKELSRPQAEGQLATSLNAAFNRPVAVWHNASK